VDRKDTGERNEAAIAREYGPFPGADHVRGVTCDGSTVWFAAGDSLRSFDPATGREARRLPVRADAGTAFDGRHLYQIADQRIVRVDAATGDVVASLPAPRDGAPAGLTWAEGTLWVAMHGEGKIHQLDPETGRVLRTIESTRFVTGVTFADGDLWYGTWDGSESALTRADPRDGTVLDALALPDGTYVTGLEYDGRDTFYCGGGRSGKIRAVQRPQRPKAR
jgi:sugar lactone lactonase YvrE